VKKDSNSLLYSTTNWWSRTKKNTIKLYFE